MTRALAHCLAVAAVCAAWCSAPVSGQTPGLPATATPNPALAREFRARTNYRANCSFDGPTRAAIVYQAPAGGQQPWTILGSCSSLGKPFPSFSLTPSSTPSQVWIAFWRRDSSGRWTQEKVPDGIQMDDEANQHFWQWDIATPSARDHASIRFYRTDSQGDPFGFATATLPRSPWSVPASPAPPPWALLTIASGYYDRSPQWNQPWNAFSAERVREALVRFNPVYVAPPLAASRTAGLTAASVLAWVRGQVRAARDKGARFVVVYYIGHAAALPQNDEWLFMKDLDPSVFPRYLPQLSASVDLDEPAPPGFLPLSKLVAELAASQSRFLLLVDACSANESFSQQLEFMELMKQSWDITDLPGGGPGGGDGDPIGDIMGIMGQIGFGGKVRQYGLKQNVYLGGNDPIILAAAPGRMAQALPWRAGLLSESLVGPLAYNILTRNGLAPAQKQRPSLAVLLRSLVQDSYGEKGGRLRTIPKGSITWSDFAEWMKAAGGIFESR